MSIKRKALRSENRATKNKGGKIKVSLKERLLRGLLAIGFTMAPWAMPSAYADIVRVDGGTTDTVGSVHNIYAGQVKGDNAINRFQKFDLPANQIANMYFKTKGGTTEATSLFNFVNSRINIDGTVNALRSNTIGGHMYFLSKDGLTLGSKGVINAGALTIMNGVDFPGSNGNAFSKIEDVLNLKQDQGDGSIDIKGTINAVDLVNIVSNYKLNVNSGAKITTTSVNGKRDFTQLVNIGNINSGLASNLVVSRSQESKGNVALIARATDYNEDNAAIHDWLDVATKNTVGAYVNVEGNTTIKADGEASIGAYADCYAEFGDLATFGNIGQSRSGVTIAGTVEGDKVNIVSSATNNFTQSVTNKIVTTGRKFATEWVQRAFKTGDVAGLEIDVVGLKAYSDLTVASGANITATGKDTTGEGARSALNLQSISNVVASQGAAGNTTGKDKRYFGAGVLLSRLENDAKLNVEDGASLATTDKEGSITAAANAKTSTDLRALAAPNNTSMPETAYVTVSLNVNNGYTNSEVNIAKNAKLNAAKDVNILANTSLSTSNLSLITNAQDVYVSTSMLYMDMESSADVNVNGLITAGNDVKLDAKNTDKIFTKASNNTTEDGAATWLGYLANPTGGDFASLTNTIINGTRNFVNEKWGWLSPVADPVFQSNGWTAGATINVTRLKNEANINIGNTANITAAKDINIKALQGYDDLLCTAVGTSSKIKNPQGEGGTIKKEIVVSAAIGYVEKNDAANVNIAGSTAGNAAKLVAKTGDINISANAEYIWNRYNSMVNSLMSSWDAVTVKNLRDSYAEGQKVPAELEAYYQNPTVENFEKLQLAIANTPDFFSGLGDIVQQVLNVGSLVRKAEQFANAAMYTNVNVGTTVRPVSKSEEDVSVAISGAVLKYGTKANVVVGRDAELTAGKNIDITSKTKMVDANYFGTSQGILGTFGSDWGLPDTVMKVLGNLEIDVKVLPGWSRSEGDVYGGNIGITVNDIESNTVIAEGAKLTAQSIKANADTDLQRVLVTLGGGSAGNTGVTGMMSVNYGNTNSIVSVDNEAKIIATGTNGLALNADNDSLLFNVDGDITASHSKAIGVSFGYSQNNVITAAGIFDNDKATLESAGTLSEDSTEEKRKKQILQALNDSLSSTQKGSLGNTDVQDAAFNIAKLSIDSTSTPEIISVGVAGAVSTKKNSREANAGEGRQDASGANVLVQQSQIEMTKLGANNAADDTQNNILNSIESNQSNARVNNNHASFTNLIGAGAVQISRFDGVTASLLENAQVNFTTGSRALDLYAHEDGLTATVAGAMALRTGSKEGASSVAMLSGTSAVNAVNMDVLAQVKDAIIKDALSITNEAKQAETIAAAAAPISLDVTKSDLNIGFTTAMNASVNLIDNHVHANLNNNNVSMTDANLGNLTRVQNLAYDASTQITGGISLEVAKTAGLGLNAVFAQMKNDVQANVIKGTYMSIDGFDNIAASDLLQINAAVGVAAGSNNLALGAIWSHAKLDNNIEAVIDGATITAKNVANEAVDAAVDDKKQASANWKEVLLAVGFDAEGTEYKDVIQSEKVDLEFNEEVFDTSVEEAKQYKGDLDDKQNDAAYNEENYTSKKLELSKDKNSTVINGALSLATEGGDRGNIACAVAVTDAVVDNDYTASIKNAKITASDTAKGVTSLVHNDNLIVDFAAGISGTGSQQSLLSGAGSAAAVQLRNDAVASIENSEISSAKIDVQAKNAADIVDVAGAMSIGMGGTKVGIGLSVAASDIENTTTAKALGSTLQGYNGGATAVDIQSLNNGDIKTIAAGIVGTVDKSYLAAYGNVAVNVGHNNTEAYVDHSLGENNVIKNSSKINKASTVNVYAEDTTEEVAAAAGANITGSKAAVGLSFAVNRLDDQSLKAALNNTAVTTAQGANINVETNEKIALKAIGVGAGLGIGNSYANFQGAASITLARNKQNIAELNGGSIEGATSDSADAEVVVKAYQENEIIGTGDAISASFSSKPGAAVGIGAVGINLDSTTKASINNIKKLNAKDVEVNALGKQRIYDVAVGISASAQTVNGAGSLSFNILNDDVAAAITGSTINATNSVGVLAKGDDQLINVTGGLNLGFASTVGIGVAVASNSMAGNVTATVNNSDITALGKGSKELTAHEYTTSEDEKTKNKLTLTETQHKGLVVDAYSKHDITDVVVSGGLAVNVSSVGVALNGLGATTEMTGTTGAYLENSSVNKNSEDTNGDVVVTAYDAATLHDVAVNVAAAFGNAAVSVGAAVALSDYDRTIEAKTSNGTINAAKLIDTAVGKTSNHMVTVGVSASVSATGSAGVGALVDSVNSKNKVHAEISQVTSKNDGVTLKAAHDNYLNYTGVGIVAAGGQGSGSVGVAVGTINDTNTITGVLDKVNVTHRDDQAEDYFAVTNYSNTTPDLIAVTLSAGIGSGSVGVASDSHSAEDLLSLNIKNSSFGLDKKAKNVHAKVDNHYIINKTSTNISIAGSLGGGVGVSVQPVTINSSDLLNITGSNFAATGNVNFTANETRDIDMVCVNVAGSTLIGVGVTNTMVVLGGKQDSVVTTTNNGELDKQMSVDLAENIKNADNAVNEGKQMVVDSIDDAGKQMNAAASEIKTEETSQNTLTTEIADIKTDIAARDHYAQMGTEAVSGVTLKASNTNVTAKDINIEAITKDDIDIVSGTGTLGLVGVNVNTASLKENVSNNLEILGGTYVADNTAILGTITGEAKTRAVMASVAGVGVNVAHARVAAEGKGNNVTVEGASLTNSKGLLVRALHDTDYFSYSDDYGVNVIQGGYLEAKTEDKLDNKLRVANSKLINTAENEPITTEGVSTPDTNTDDKSAMQAKTGSMEIAAMKMSQVRTKSRYGGVNGIGGLNSYASSKVDATNRLDFSQNEVKDISSIDLAKAGILVLYSRYSTVTDCYLNFGGGSVIAGGGGVFGVSENKGQAILNVDKNSFDVANLRAQSLVTGINDNVLAKNHGQTINIAVGIGASKNKLETTIDTAAQTSLSDNSFAVSNTVANGNIIAYKEVEKLDADGNKYTAYEPVYEQLAQETAKTALEILAETNAKADSDISCVNVGGILAVGHNDGVVTINESTDASLTGKQNEATLLKSLILKTKGTNDVYNKVYGGGGGILSISPYAATAENVLTVTNDVKLKGKFKVQEAAAVEALQSDIIEIQADTESGGALLDVAGGSVKNTRNANSHTIVTLSEAELEADSASIVAQNNMDLNKKFRYGMKGGSGAGIIAAASPTTFTNIITELAGVEIGKSSVATANNLHIQAATENNIFALSLFENGSILVGVNQATVNNTLSYTNQVNMDIDSKLTTGAADSLLDINSVDNTLLNVGSYAHAYGALLTVASPETNNTTKRNNYVNIAGSVNSANDLAINAGQYADASIAGLTAVIDVMTYSGGLIPARDRKLTNEIEQHNVVTISGSTTSIADTDLYANEGAVNITVNNISSGSYSSDKNTKGYVSSDTASTNPSDVSLKGENKVKLEGGSVVAGAKHSVQLTIGQPGEVVILNEQERAAFKASNPRITVTGTPVISGAGDLEQAVEFKQVNLSTELYGQYLKQQDVVASYSTNKSSEAYAVALAELKAIEDQLIALGMTSRDAQGNILVTGSVVADAVVLPKISVSGGNVNINTQDIAATDASIKAYGTPTASIINNTSLYLILDDINVGERGGEIKYNTTKLEQGDAAALTNNTSLIKSLNKNVKDISFISFANLHAEASEGGKVAIQSDYAGAKEFEVKITHEGEQVTAISKLMPNIELGNGASIINKSGNIDIYSAAGDIVLNGNVNGKEINVKAAQGSLYQNSVQGLVNIGGDVKQQYASLVQNVINNEASYLKGDAAHMTGSYTSDTVAASDESKGTIMGSSVYISADTINVNGLIQSGYAEYKLEVGSEAELQKINELNTKYANSNYTDDEIVRMGGNSQFVVVAGGQVYDSAKGCYYYKVPVYYNPATKKLLVPNVEDYGGNISLTGKIASTGNGRLVAMDGTYDIAANNKTTYDLKLYGLTTTNVEGKITIVDTAKHQQTELTRTSNKVTDFTSGVTSNGSISGSYTYKPLANQRYSWSLGKDESTRAYYERKYETNWWGLRESVDVTSHTGDYTKTSEVKLAGTAKDEASAITKLEGYTNNFAVSLDKQKTSESKSDVTETRWTTGLFGFRKHQLYKWYEDTGYSYTYNASVDASKDISISFIGNTDKSSTISVSSGGSIDVHGNIGSKDFNNTIDLTSNQGGIYQDKGYLRADSVTLQAVGAMSGINILSGSELSLSATNNAKADTIYWRNGVGSTTGGEGNAININVETQLAGVNSPGTVKLVGTNGNANNNSLVSLFDLSTNGSIVSGTNTAISAARVDLTATNGSIGTASKAILVNTGDIPVVAADSLSASLNAQAKGDIYLAESSGDMRIGKIYSDEGDVSLSGPGSLVDALPYDSVHKGRSEAELVALWESLGLLENKTAKETTTLDNGRPLYEYKTTSIKQADGSYKVVTEKVQARDAEGRLLYEVEEKVQAWDAQRLLYAISNSIINPEPGVELPTKVANIKADNLSLNMGDSAGLNSNTTTVYKIDELGMREDLADLKDIARADARDVTWDAVNNEVRITRKLPIGVMLKGTVSISAGQINGADNGASNISGNVYLEGRKDSLANTQAADLNIKQIAAKGDVILANASGSVLNANSNYGMAVIKANNLTIDAGPKDGSNGSIGEAAKWLNVSIKGGLNATSNAGIYIEQIGADTLLLQGIASKGDIYLTALNDIVSDTSLGNNSYINLVNQGSINLQSLNGNVGTETNWLRVLNGEEAITNDKHLVVEAAKSAYIKGMSTAQDGASAGGTLYVENIAVGSGESINLDANGGIYFVKAQAATIDAKAALSVEQSQDSILEADVFYVQAGKGIKLAGDHNKLHKVALFNSGSNTELQNITEKQSSTIINSGDMDLELVAVGRSKEAASEAFVGDLVLKNTASGLANDINITGRVVVEGAVDIENAEHSIHVPAAPTAAAFSVSADSITLLAEEQVTNAGALVARNGISISGKTADNLMGGTLTTANGNITLTAANGSIKNKGMLTVEQKGNISIEAKKHVINRGVLNIQGAGNIALTSGEQGSIFSLKDGELYTGEGNIDLLAKSSTYSVVINGNAVTNDDAALNAADEEALLAGNVVGAVINSANAAAIGGTFAITSSKGSIFNFNNFSNSNAESGDLTFNLASQDIKLAAAEGSIINNIDLYSEARVSLLAKSGLSNLSYTIFGAKGVTLQATEGDVINSSVIESSSGDIRLLADKGSVVNVSGADLVTAGGNVILESGAGAVVDNQLYYATNQGEIVSLGEQAVYSVNRYYLDNGKKVILTATMEAPANAAVKTEILGANNVVLVDLAGDIAVFRKGAVVNYGNTLAGINADVKNSGNIILQSAKGDVFNYFDFNNISKRADGSISAKYTDSGYEMGAGIDSVSIAANDLTLSAVEGKVFNSKRQLTAGRDVSIIAKEGMANFAYDVQAGRNITLTATEGLLVNNAKLTAASGIIKLEAQNGSVVNMLHGDAVAQEGSVAMLAGGAHTEQLQLVDTNGKITQLVVNAVAETGSASDLKLIRNNETAGNYTILVDKYYSNGGSYVRMDEHTDITSLTTEQQASIVTVFYRVNDSTNTKHLVTDFEAEGLSKATITVNNTNIVGVQGDVEAFRQGDVINRGNIVAGGGSVALQAAQGNIINYDNYELFNGKTNTEALGTPKIIKAHMGTSIVAGLKIYNNMDITAGEDLLISGGDSVISGQAYNHLYALGKLIIESTGSSLVNNADLVGEKGVILRAYGDLTNTGNITSHGVVELLAGGIENSAGKTLNAEAASLTNSGDLTAGSHVRVETNIGDITLTGVDIVAKNNPSAVAEEQKGYINIATNSGNIVYSNGTDTAAHSYVLNAKAEDGITVQTGNGSIISTVNYEAGKSIALTAANTGTNSSLSSISQVGNLQAGPYAVDNEGYAVAGVGAVAINGAQAVSVQGDVFAAEGINITSSQGAVTLQGELKAGTGIDLAAKGKITAAGDMYAGKNISVGHNIDATHAAAVEITNSVIKAKNNITLEAEGTVNSSKNLVTSEIGSIILQSFTEGDVLAARNKLKAENDVVLLAKKGNVVSTSYKDDGIYPYLSLVANEGMVKLFTEQGNVSTKGIILSATGVTLEADKGNVSNAATVMSNGAVSLQASGSYVDEQGKMQLGAVVNNGVLVTISDENVKLKATGSVNNNAAILADGGSIELLAGASIANNAALAATGGHVSLMAGDNVENMGGGIVATKNITLTGGGFVVNRASALASSGGNISLSSTGAAGGVQNLYSSLTARQGQISLTANKGDVLNAGQSSALTAGQDIVLATNAGAVRNKAAATTEVGKIALTTGSGSVTNEGKLTINNASTEANKGTVELRGTDFVKNTGAIKAQGQVDLVAEQGYVLNQKAISTTKGGVNLNGVNSVTNYGTIEAVDTVTLGSTNGAVLISRGTFAATDVINVGAVTSAKGGISLIGSGDIFNYRADLLAGSSSEAATGSIVLQSTGTGDVDNYESILIANKGNITLKTNSGDVLNYIVDTNEYRFVDTDIVLTAAEVETIEIDGSSMYALNANGERCLVVAHSITNLSAAQDVLLQAGEGDILNDGGIEAKQGSITEQTAKGAVYNLGDLTAEKGVSLEASADVYNVFADITSKTEGITLKSTLSGDVYNETSDLKAQKDVLLQAQKGDIVNSTSDINATAGSISLRAVEAGDIYNLNNSLTADAAMSGTQNISMTTAKGALLNFGADLTASGSVELKSAATAEYGDVQNVNSSITAGGTVTLQATKGGLVNYLGAIEAGKKLGSNADVQLLAAYDVLNLGSAITTDKGSVVLQSTSGDVTNDFSTITTREGNISIVTESGAIENAYSNLSTSNGNITVDGTKDVVLNNSAVAAQGNVSISSSSGAYGEVLLTESNITAGTGAGGTASITSSNGDIIIRNSDVRAGAEINMAATKGNISNFNVGDVVVATDSHVGVTVTAEKNVEVTSLAGNIDNYGVTTAEKEDVSLTAFAGSVINYANITANGGTISLAAYAPDKSADKGDVSSLNIYNVNTVLSAGKGVDLFAMNELQNDSDVKVQQGNITITSVNSSVDMGVNSNNDSKLAVYTVEQTGNIIVKADKDIINQTKLQIGNVTNKTGGGNIYLTSAQGGITNQGDAELVTANGNITMLAEKNIVNNGEAYARGGEIYIESFKGDVNNTDDFDVYKGTKTDLATSHISIMAKEGTLSNTHNLVSGGNITLVAKDGLQNFSYYLSAIGDVSLTATAGDLINSTAILSQQGSIYLTAEQGAVVNVAGGAVANMLAYDVASDNFTLVENISMHKGDLYALGGDVILRAGGQNDGTTKNVLGVSYGSGDVINMGSIVALGSHKVAEAAETVYTVRNQTLASTLTEEYFEPGKVGLYSAHGNVLNKDTEYGADGSRNADALMLGNTNYVLSLGDIELIAEEGYLLNNFNIDAGGSVRAVAKEDVSFRKSGTNGQNAMVITRVGGDLGISSITGIVDGRDFDMTANGNILVEGYQGIELSSDVTSLTGSVMLAAANGSIYKEVSSQTAYGGTVKAMNGMAAIGAGLGDIEVKAVLGKDVVLYAPKGDFKVNLVGAFDSFTAQAQNMSIDELKNLNSDASGKAPALAIMGESYTSKHNGDIHFSYLNVNSADIVVENGSVAIDKLQVKDTAHITASGYKVGIFGPAGKIYRDDSAAIFFDANRGTAAGDRPIADLSDFFNFNGEHTTSSFHDRFSHISSIIDNMQQEIASMDRSDTWNKDTKGWMNLYIDSGSHARSNGILLHRKYNYYVDNARYPVDDLARIILQTSPYGLYDLAYYNTLGLDFTRYDLIDVQQVALSNEREVFSKESDIFLFESVLEDGEKIYKLGSKSSIKYN